jgi:iron complex outermembrane recepter protein
MERKALKAIPVVVFSVVALPAAQAQTQLPGIVITTPSPVAPAPAPKAAPVQAPVPASVPAPKAAPQPKSAQQSAPAAPVLAPQPAPAAAAPPALALPPGIALGIVDDASFVAVTAVTGRELLSQTAPTLGDALGTRPGIATTGFAPGASRPVIRGLSGFRVSVQENGMGTGDVQKLSDDHAVPVDPNSATQVEVVRGPATLRYGSQAIGGVVNATNSRIPDVIPANGFRAEVKGGLNSVDRGQDGAAMVEAGAGNFAVHADTFKRSTNDYNTPQGRQRNTSVDSEGYSLGGSFIGSEGYAGLAYTSFASTYFIPGAEAAARKNHIVLDQTKWTSKGEWRVNDHGLEAIRYWFSALDYKHDEIDGLGAAREVGSTFLNKQTEARVEAQHQPLRTALGELRGAVGGQWGRRTLSAGGGEGQLLDPTRTVTTAGFIFEELQVTKQLRLQAAARIEKADVKGTASTFPPGFLPPPDDPEQSPAAKTFIPRSGSVGLLYEFPLGIVARLTAQHVERAPDATELFYKGPHDSTQTFEIGDPNLKIEKADTAEIGLKRARGAFRFDASVYQTKFKDFIFKRFTGAKCDGDFASCGAGAELDQVVYSQRDATFTGFELLAEQDIGRVWNGVWGVEGRYDLVNARFDDGTHVPKISPQRLGGGLFYRDRSWLARVSLLHAFRQDQIAEFETPTVGYNLLNAEVSYTFKLREGERVAPEMTIGVKGENLLDDDIRNHVSFKKDEVLAPGRTIRLFGSVKLN